MPSTARCVLQVKPFKSVDMIRGRSTEFIYEIALGEDDAIGVQFGHSVTLAMLDQSVVVLSVSRWASHEGTSARAGAQHHEH
jgi:hypothetical protein